MEKHIKCLMKTRWKFAQKLHKSQDFQPAAKKLKEYKLFDAFADLFANMR